MITQPPSRNRRYLRRRKTHGNARSMTPRQMELLRLMARMPRRSWDEYADLMGVTTSAVWQMAQRLVSNGHLIESVRGASSKYDVRMTGTCPECGQAMFTHAGATR